MHKVPPRRQALIGPCAVCAAAQVRLRARVSQLDGGASEIQALLTAQAEVEKEKRVELLRRQVVRRMMNASIVNGWSAWYELWAAKTYAMARLRQAATRLHAPQLERAFSCWERVAQDAKMVQER